MHESTDAVVRRFKRGGFVAGVPILDSNETARHRARMVAAEAALGHLHYQAFHHGWTLHASLPNRSDERRIGFNVQYIATHMRQTQHDRDTGLLVCGVDDYGHFAKDIPAESDLEPDAVERQRDLDRMVRETMGHG